MNTSSEAHLLPLAPGHRLCIVHAPTDVALRGWLIALAPFAEEMNRSRRMLSVTARRFARAGYAVIVPDLMGCGDSSGDFGEADWVAWRRDVDAIRRWGAQRFAGPCWLWGVRAGALLAAAAAADAAGCNLVFWQPVLSGRAHLTQFLRIKVVGGAVSGATAREDTGQIRERLRRGLHEEVAGYRISPALAEGLDAAVLTLPEGFRGEVIWCEVSGTVPATLGPASLARQDEWREGGIRLKSAAVEGPPFWQTAEITECPALIDATVAALVESIP